MSIVFLSDSPLWCKPLADVLQTQFGVTAVVLDAMAAVLPHYEPSRLADASLATHLAGCKVLVNRMSARPGGDTTALVTFFRSVMGGLALVPGGPTVVNGSMCHDIGASKLLQAAVFAAVGARTPRTVMVTRSTWAATLARLSAPPPPSSSAASSDNTAVAATSSQWLLKPNVGGKGAGILAVAAPDAWSAAAGEPPAALPDADVADTFGPDGVAVLQAVVPTPDKMVHRVELVNGRPIYTAHVPVDDGTGNYNNCVSDVCARPAKKKRIVVEAPPSVVAAAAATASDGKDVAPPTKEEGGGQTDAILAMCATIAAACRMQLGSIEYLLDADGAPWFIDINPVSTVLKEAEAVLGESPLAMQGRWLASLVA